MSATRSSGQVSSLAAGFVLSLWLMAAGTLALFGCVADAHEPAAAKDKEPIREPIPRASGKQQNDRLCGRGRRDVVLDVFCPDAPHVGSLLDLRRVLGLASNENLVDQGYALLAHSTSLALRVVSAINPRVIFIRPQTDRNEFLSLAFARGEQTAEIIARDRVGGLLQFYLVTFTQDCNQNAGGCSPGDLLTEAVESDWQNVNVYAEEDLEGTPNDCRVCHQPDGPGTPKFLRMQELEAPWNHWFWRQSASGKAVLSDYAAAKGDEPFAGLSGEEIVSSQPGLLGFALFSVGSKTQPNAFVSAQIEEEVTQSAAALGGDQPTDNSVPGQSKTWDAIYETAKRGDAISVPYHDVKVTDANKLAEMTQAYVDYREGRLDRQDLPDLRDVFLDDPERRAEIGLGTQPGLDGKGVLLQACAQCHNDRLDQSLSRARFNTDLSTLDRVEKDRAIARLRIPADQPSAMPPATFRTLSDEARSRLIELLKR